MSGALCFPGAEFGCGRVGCSHVMGLFCHRKGKKMHLKSGEWKTPGVKTVAIKVIYSHGNRKLNVWKQGCGRDNPITKLDCV